MRRLTYEIKKTAQRIEALNRLDQANCSVWGKRFNENKIEALQAFLAVAENAELQADRVVHYNKKR